MQGLIAEEHSFDIMVVHRKAPASRCNVIACYMMFD